MNVPQKLSKIRFSRVGEQLTGVLTLSWAHVVIKYKIRDSYNPHEVGLG